MFGYAELQIVLPPADIGGPKVPRAAKLTVTELNKILTVLHRSDVDAGIDPKSNNLPQAEPSTPLPNSNPNANLSTHGDSVTASVPVEPSLRLVVDKIFTVRGPPNYREVHHAIAFPEFESSEGDERWRKKPERYVVKLFRSSESEKWTRAMVKDLQAIVDEAYVFNTNLKDIQGTVVPKYYGLYHGTDAQGYTIWCFVVEYVEGEVVGSDGSELPDEEK